MKKLLVFICLFLLIFQSNVNAIEIKLKEDDIEKVLMPFIDDYQDEEGKIKVKKGESSVDIVKNKILIDVPIKYKFIFDIPLTLKMEYVLEDNDLVLAKSKVLFFDQMERFENISHLNTSILNDTKFTNISIEDGYVKLGLFEDIIPSIKKEDKVNEEKEENIKEIEKIEPEKKVEISKEEKPKKPEIKEKTYNISRSDIVKMVSDNEEEILSNLDSSYGITKVSVNEDESINLTISGKDLKIFGDLHFNSDLDIVYDVTHVKYSFLKVSLEDLSQLAPLIGFDIPKGIEQITICNSYIKPYLNITSNEVITNITEDDLGFTVTTTR